MCACLVSERECECGREGVCVVLERVCTCVVHVRERVLSLRDSVYVCVSASVYVLGVCVICVRECECVRVCMFIVWVREIVFLCVCD